MSHYQKRIFMLSHRSLRMMAASALCIMMGASASYATPAESHVTEAKPDYVTKGEFDAMVNRYLMDHPEVLLKSLDNMQRATQEKGLEESKKAIEGQSANLFSDSTLPTFGAKDAPIPVVEFFDYNCSACKYMFNPIDAVKAKQIQDVRIIFVEFPIFGEKSEELAKIGLAVHALKPDAYYGFHSAMMKHKGTITKDQAIDYAGKAGIDRADLEKELLSPAIAARLKKNQDLGHAINVTGTPFMVIGKTPIPHALDAEHLDKHIENARAALKK
ncbi:MAG: DsbA family protein [Alphaproteobacteria bacterium]|nr:MAG: DsbA family protein [Alphaproteobacteria bacterium]